MPNKAQAKKKLLTRTHTQRDRQTTTTTAEEAKGSPSKWTQPEIETQLCCCKWRWRLVDWASLASAAHLARGEGNNKMQPTAMRDSKDEQANLLKQKRAAISEYFIPAHRYSALFCFHFVFALSTCAPLKSENSIDVVTSLCSPLGYTFQV